MSQLTQSPAWQALQAHAGEIATQRIDALFDADSRRAQDFAADGAGLHLDFSKQLASRKTLELLLALAAQQDVGGWIARMCAGERINHTENRAALHVALRAPDDTPIVVDGHDVMPKVREVRERFLGFAEEVRQRGWRGADGEPVTDVVNIGIGGSDLGPRMVCEALAPFADGPRTHFVANVDGAVISRLLRRLHPQTTLFVVTSKTFTTQETMANAAAARQWLAAALGEDAVERHFVAVSTNRAAVAAFGIAPENMFEFWDWVGGRYSLWSSVGLSIALELGRERFRALLQGAQAMDRHFRETEPARNLPLLLGLLAVWNQNFLHRASHVVAPYAQCLAHFPAWLQQLEMESNGKTVDRDGRSVDYPTTAALWGDVGTNAQHAFFQMLHQGSQIHSVDFVLPLGAEHELQEQHRMLVANCLAQGAALMRGRGADPIRAELQSAGLSGAALDAAVAHRTFSGNRPSTTILLPTLDPYHLGALLALYEHRTFVCSVLWNINAFDQWGVELGKRLAQDVLSAMRGGSARLDASTAALLRRFMQP